jgi:hypothetical protein
MLELLYIHIYQFGSEATVESGHEMRVTEDWLPFLVSCSLIDWVIGFLPSLTSFYSHLTAGRSAF